MHIEAIRQAQPGTTIWDKGDRGSVGGLHLRVLPTGKKVFLLYYRAKNGKQRRPKIGEFGDITVAEARKRARKIMDRVAIGEDPKAEWDEARAEMTVGELFKKVLADHWSKERFIKSGRNREVKTNWKNHLEPNFGRLKLSEVTAVSIRKWHGSLSEKPYVANRSLEVLSRMFSYAEEQGHRNQGTNPCTLVSAHKEMKRKRFASVEEIQRLAPILEREAHKHPVAVAFLYLLIFSGSRPRAIERATWEQLQTFQKDGQTYGILTFAGKSTEATGEDEVVVLPPQAMKVIDTLPRVAGGTITGIKLPKKLWRSIKAEAGCGDLWARDFRRTFATVGMSNGVSLGMIGELLNHHSTQTTKTYAKLMHDSRVKAASEIASKIEATMVSGREKDRAASEALAKA